MCKVHMRRHTGHFMYLKIEGEGIIYNAPAGPVGELEVNLGFFVEGLYCVLQTV